MLGAFAFNADDLGAGLQDPKDHRIGAHPPAAAACLDKRGEQGVFQFHFRQRGEKGLILFTAIRCTDIDVGNAQIVQRAHDAKALLQLNTVAAFKGCIPQCGVIGLDDSIHTVPCLIPVKKNTVI